MHRRRVRCDAELVAVLMLVFLVLPVLILPSAFAEPNRVTHLTNSNVIQLAGIDVTVTASHTSGTTGNLILSVQLATNPLTNTPLGIDQFYYNAANGVISVTDPGCLPPKSWDVNKGGKTADSFGQFDSDKSQCGGGDGGITAPIVFTISGDPLIPTNARSAKYALHLRFSDECSGWISDGVAESPESNSGCTPIPPTLEVSKTASTFLNRTYQWTINKSVTPDTWMLPTGESGTSTYTVSVEKTGYTDSDWLVNGTITVKNTGQTSATIASVSDTISPAISATVDCGGASFPYDLAADATLKCAYSASLPNNSSRTNTATVTVGATQFNATAAVDFTGATVKEVYGSINVDDTNDGRTWTFTESNSESYTKTFTCDIDQGQHNNTATIRETGQFDDATVMVECSGGQTAALTVIKHVIRDHKGMKEAEDFMIHVMYYNATEGAWLDVPTSPQPGNETGTLYSGLNPGVYRVSEDPPPPLYVQVSITGDCDPDDGTVTVEANTNKECTITNKDPALVVIKHVIGGSNSASDFAITVNGKNADPATFPGSESGTRVVLDPDVYSVTETPIAGYTTTYSANCSGTIVVDEPTKTCIITNENSADRPPQPVGGELYSVDKSALVRPYVGLLGLLGAVAAAVAITRGRRP